MVTFHSYVCQYQRVILLVLSREWMRMGVAGIITDSNDGSFPHSLLSTGK